MRWLDEKFRNMLRGERVSLSDFRSELRYFRLNERDYKNVVHYLRDRNIADVNQRFITPRKLPKRPAI